MNVDDKYIAFINSYITREIPVLQDSKLKRDDMVLYNHIEKSYDNALKKWTGDNNIRERLACKKYSSISQLKELYSTTEWKNDAIALQHLTYLWAVELQNDKECSFYIENNQELTNNNIHVLSQNYATNTISQCIYRGLYEHNAVDCYIRRYCSLEQEQNVFLDYLLGHNDKFTLADFVLDIQNTSKNKFILYSSAQTGKTTELKQLCWELQQSGLYLPLYFEVRLNTELKRVQLPNVKFIDGKEIVVVIDALDEVNGIKYNDLLEEIEGYAFDHPKTKMVLSCRSNYRNENQLNQFTKLYLDELSSDDIKSHIVHKLGRNNRLFATLAEKQLIYYAKNPFFLNILIKAYNSNKQLPKNKAEIYRLFIESSYQNVKRNNSLPFDESLQLFERIALALSLMNKQSLNKEDFLECLNKTSDLEECLRYDLIQCEDGMYSFKHSAFREWLVANYLQRNGIDKAKQLATHPNDHIKQEWYNIIILWLSMFDNDRRQEISEVLEWLSEAGTELIVHIDKGLLDEDKRNDVFEKILLKYKDLGIRMSNITTRDYSNLLAFGQSEDTISFIIDEISTTTSGTSYYADLMCLCYFMDWYKFSEQTQNHLYEVLEQKVKNALINKNDNDLTFIFFGNRFFEQHKYVERLFEIVKESNYFEAISSMIKLISKSNKVDDYLDYILGKEQYVHDQQNGNTTLSVSRSTIYEALSKVETLDGVKKVLFHQFPYIEYDFEQKEYLKMMESIINKISDFIINGNKDLVDEIKSFYSLTFKDYDYQFDRYKIHQGLLLLLRNCYQKTGLYELERKKFNENISSIFETNNADSILKAFSTAALWITTDDVKLVFNKFASDNQQDQIKALWYCKIPFREVAEYANVLYKEKYYQTLPETKRNEKQQTEFNEFEDYNLFRQIVWAIIADLKNITNHSSLKDYLWKQGNGYNQHALLFVSRYIDNNDDLTIIENAIDNQECYESFFVTEVAGMILSTHLNNFVTDNAKERCITYAKKSILNVCNGGQKLYFFETALSLMLKGCFEIDNDCLLKLLDYSDFYIYLKDEDGFTKMYYLFDYIKERVEFENLTSLIINKFQDNYEKGNEQSLSVFATYIIENHIVEGYGLATKYALKGDIEVLSLIIKNKIELEEVKSHIGKMSSSDKLTCYSLLVDNANEREWVKQQLENDFQSFNKFQLKRAITLLSSLGSIVALKYLANHLELLDDNCDFRFNYDNPAATNDLCTLIKYCKKDIFNTHTSILTSLTTIAIKNEESFVNVKKQVFEIAQTDNQYAYLNRYLLSLDEKYYTSRSGIKNIKNVLKIIDADADDFVYISYKWEDLSSVTVDYLCLVLETNGIPYKRDKKDCNYTDNIKEFMNAIRNGHFVIVVLSKEYLESHYCMYELSGIMEWNNYEERLLPIRVDKDIKDDEFYVDLIKYWKQKKDEKEKLANQIIVIDSSKAEPIEQKYNEIEIIYDLLPIIKKYIDTTNTLTLSKMSETRFEPIICKIRGISKI